MSVRVSKDHGIISQDLVAKTVVARLFADAKEDVTDGMTVIDMPVGYTLDTESFVIVANGDIAQLKSDGTWSWVGEEEESTRSVVSLTKSAPSEQKEEEQPEEERREEVSDEKPVEEEPVVEEPAEREMR